VSRLSICLLTLVIVAPLSIGCSSKTNTPMVSLSDMDPKEFIEILKSKPTVGMDARITAAKQLGAMGPRAKDALPDLEKLTQDKNPTLAAAAQEAISKIKGQ